MPNALSFGAATHVGLVRNNNEDCYLASPELGLWLIADGMGGHDAGEVASDIVRTSVSEQIINKQKLVQAIENSHYAVKNAALNNIGSPNMGTTIIVLQDFGAYYQIAWVGDSRAYLWDPLTSQLSQLSRDHSYVQALFDAGSITAEEMHNHPQKNVITQSLGITQLDTVRVDTLQKNWASKQRIILCSDGLSDLLTDDELAVYCRKFQNKSEQDLVDVLIEAALECGGKDNVTVEVISAPNPLPSLEPSPSTGIFNSKYLIPITLAFCSLGVAIAYLFTR